MFKFFLKNGGEWFYTSNTWNSDIIIKTLNWLNYTKNFDVYLADTHIRCDQLLSQNIMFLIKLQMPWELRTSSFLLALILLLLQQSVLSQNLAGRLEDDS